MKSIYQIYESVILEAMSLEEIFKKFYEKDLENFDEFSRINEVDPTASKDKKGKYLDWLVRKAFKNNPKRFFEDKSKIKEDLALFDKNQRKIGKQIGQIKDQYELAEIVNNFREKKEKGEIDLSRSEIKKDAEKIFEDSSWLIIVPKTEVAAKYYGAHTRWCTAADEDNKFDYYNKQGPLYIIIDKKNNKKYQFHFQSKQYMNENDEEIEDFSIFSEKILDILINIVKKNNKVIEFINKFNYDIKKEYLKKYPKELNIYNLSRELIDQINKLHPSIDKVKDLVEKGADIHAENDEALRSAVHYGYLDIVKYLVEKGANIRTGDDYALRYAAYSGHLEVVKYLVENGADIHADNDVALRYAVSKGHLEVVKYLVEKGADIHAYNDAALRSAASKGYLEVVKYLVENGANIHTRNDAVLRYAKTKEIKDYLQQEMNKKK